jgi:hypothetical protein
MQLDPIGATSNEYKPRVKRNTHPLDINIV